MAWLGRDHKDNFIAVGRDSSVLQDSPFTLMDVSLHFSFGALIQMDLVANPLDF